MKKIIMISAMIASLGGCNWLTNDQVKALNEDHNRLDQVVSDHQELKDKKLPSLEQAIEQKIKALTDSTATELVSKPSKDYVDGLYVRMGKLEARMETNDTNARLAIASIARRGHKYVMTANQPVVLPPPPADPDEDVTPVTAPGDAADPALSTASVASPPAPTATAAVESPAEWQALIAHLNEQQADLGIEEVLQQRLQRQAAYFIASAERFDRAEAAMKAVRGEVSRAHARLDSHEAVNMKQGADIKDLQQRVDRLEAQPGKKEQPDERMKSSQLPQRRRRVYDDAFSPYYGYTVHRQTGPLQGCP